MALQTIGVGSAANDGNGDDLRAAMVKVNANFVEAYGESDSFTPALAGETTPGVFTYSTQTGTWVAMGEIVYCQIDIVTSAETTAAVGSMEISGFPETLLQEGGGLLFQNWGGIDLPTGFTHIGGRFVTGPVLDLYRSGDNVANARLDAADLSATVEFRGVALFRRSI